MRVFRDLAVIVAAAMPLVAARTNVTAAEAAALQQMQEVLPTCAMRCLATLVPQSGCSMTDTACLCTNTKLNQASAVCSTSNCTVPEALATQKYRSNMCGVPVRNRSAQPRTVGWVLFSFALFCLIMRFVARSRATDGPGHGWDDWTILIATSALCANAIITDIMTRHGLGQDMYMLEPHDITEVLKLKYANSIAYMGVVAFTKVSFLLLYLRIFPKVTVSSWFRNTCYVLIALISGYAVSMWFSIIFECTPINFNWTSWDMMHEGKCVNTHALIYTNSAINIVLDLLVFFLPFPKIWELHLSGRKKFAVSLTFVVGLFTTICTIIRLRFLVKWGETTNPTWDYTEVTTWSLVESGISIVCSCLPPMAYLMKKWWKKTDSHVSSRNNKSGGHSQGFTASQSVSDWQDGSKGSKRSIAKTATTVVHYDDRGPSASGDEVELVSKVADPAWDSGHLRQGV